MTESEARDLWARVKADADAWRGCQGPHELTDITPQFRFGKRYQCGLCGGTCDEVAKLNYEQGLRHGRATG